MKHLLISLTALALLSACGSTVKLDTVPVEDKSGTMVSPSVTPVSTSGAGSGTVAKGSVASIDIEKSTQPLSAHTGLKIIYFDYDSFSIKPEFQSVVEAHAKYIRADKSKKIGIEGHTDDRGGREYNLALGQKRAEAVRSALGLLGVAEGQVEAVSFGKEKPAVQGVDEMAQAKNRRVEINYR